VIFSPTTEPIEAMMKFESMMPKNASRPSIAPRPMTTASCRPVFCW